ncbi:MAG: hypothetical protein CSA79_03600 [Thiothrix nivea]|nr:MAG: hypothetical protein CSA79_03600 [Thiothrix nivea]
MIDSNFGMNKPLKVSGSNPVQNERVSDRQNVRPQNFEPVCSKNPGHDGCNVTQKQVEEAKAAEPAQTQQNDGTQKASGNCPGGNLISQLLQEILTTLKDIQIGR